MKVREENPEKKTAEQENSTRDLITELGLLSTGPDFESDEMCIRDRYIPFLGDVGHFECGGTSHGREGRDVFIHQLQVLFVGIQDGRSFYQDRCV